MPSTERNITRSVDECFNENGENYAFRLTIHEMMKIAVRIDFGILPLHGRMLSIVPAHSRRNERFPVIIC